MGIAIVTSKNHDIDIYLISRYIAKTVVLLSPNIMKCVCIANNLQVRFVSRDVSRLLFMLVTRFVFTKFARE